MATSRFMWFVRGYLIGILAVGTCTALSYFVRTGGWGSLLGERCYTEAIGFPMPIWRSGESFQVYSFSNPGFLPNLLTALALSVGMGAMAAFLTDPLNRLLASLQAEKNESHRFQISIRGLLLFTLIAAIASALARTLASHPTALAGIYLFGPLGLIVAVMIPRGLRWQQRVAIIAPGAIVLIIVASIMGLTLGVEIDKVLLGIYVCWTPQSFFGAILLTAGLMVHHRRALTTPDAAAADI